PQRLAIPSAGLKSSLTLRHSPMDNATTGFERRELMMVRMVSIVRILAVLLGIAFRITAQVDTGVLSGSVYDSSQAPVPKAVVKLLNVGTNYRFEMTTNSAGLYVSPPLPAGTYRIQVSAPGFQTHAKETELHLSERLALDFTLEVGAVT